MSKKRAIVFGAGSFAEVVAFYLDHDSDYEVVAFTATDAGDGQGSVFGRPLVPFAGVESAYPPGDHDMYVAVGYRRLNSIREDFCQQSRAKGYKLLTYFCSKATGWGDTRIGDNVFIFEDNTVQPFVSIGDGTVLWSGNHIGHHATIGAYNFISSHVVVSGHCRIGNRCFFGVNSTLSEGVTIGDEVIVGPHSLVQKDMTDRQVVLAKRAELFPKDSTRFFR